MDVANLLTRIATARSDADAVSGKLGAVLRRGAASLVDACALRWMRNTPVLLPRDITPACNAACSRARAVVYEAGGLSEALVRVLFSLDAVACGEGASDEERATVRASRRAAVVHIQEVLRRCDASKLKLEAMRDFVAMLLSLAPRGPRHTASESGSVCSVPIEAERPEEIDHDEDATCDDADSGVLPPSVVSCLPPRPPSLRVPASSATSAVHGVGGCHQRVCSPIVDVSAASHVAMSPLVLPVETILDKHSRPSKSKSQRRRHRRATRAVVASALHGRLHVVEPVVFVR
jgi:hypothetical protein